MWILVPASCVGACVGADGWPVGRESAVAAKDVGFWRMVSERGDRLHPPPWDVGFLAASRPRASACDAASRPSVRTVPCRPAVPLAARPVLRPFVRQRAGRPPRDDADHQHRIVGAVRPWRRHLELRHGAQPLPRVQEPRLFRRASPPPRQRDANQARPPPRQGATFPSAPAQIARVQESPLRHTEERIFPNNSLLKVDPLFRYPSMTSRFSADASRSPR